MKRFLNLSVVTGLLVSTAATQSVADSTYELGTRVDIRLGSGKPTNDIPGAALILRYQLEKPGWWVGASIDHSPVFDIELPITYFGLDGTEELDSEGISAQLTVFLERHFNMLRGGWVPFTTIGAGVNSIDVDDLEGTLTTGDPYLIRIDAGTEFIIEGSAGARYDISRRWSVYASALLQHRFADWTVKEIQSNQVRTINDYTVHGLYLGANYRF